MSRKPKHAYEIPRNEETSEEDLHRCIIEAARSGDPNVELAAAEATAELARRERVEWEKRFNAESRARDDAQKFQQGQTDRLLTVTETQATAARRAMLAAWAAAIATVAIAIISAISLLDK